MAGENYLIKIQLDIQNDAALQAMVRRLEDAARQAPRTADALKKTGAAIDDFGQRNKRMGSLAQNAGYQVQDLIVQISSGQDPMRALSQQLPQLAMGFGAMGAAIGIVAAAIPALIALFRDAEEATVSWADALSEAESAVESLGSVSEGFDLDNWVKAFNEANAAGQALLQTSLELELIDLQKAGEKLAKALPQSGFPSIPEGSILTGPEVSRDVALNTYKQLEYAAALGLTVEQAKELEAVYEKARSGGVTAPEATTKLIKDLENTKIAMGGLTEEAEAQLKALKDLQVIQDKYAKGVERSGQAAAGYGQVLSEVTPGGQRRSGGGGGGGRSGRGGGQPRDNSAQVNRERLAAADALIKQGDRYLKQLQETYDAERKVMGERLKLWQEFNPELTAYANEVNRANQALQANIITQEQFNEIQRKAQVTMEEGLEGWTLQGEAIRLFDEGFNTMLDGVLSGTQDLADGFKDMAKVIIAQLLKLAAYQGIASAFGGTAIGDNFAKLLPQAKGNAFAGGNVIPFARGGIVNGPTIFPMAKGMGLMGEAGPEAVMPLKRGADGKLGVSGGGMNVTINNMAGVDVRPRQTDQGLTIDVVMRSVSQAIQRGGNEVSDSMERTYSLGRGRGVY